MNDVQAHYQLMEIFPSSAKVDRLTNIQSTMHTQHIILRFVVLSYLTELLIYLLSIHCRLYVHIDNAHWCIGPLAPQNIGIQICVTCTYCHQKCEALGGRDRERDRKRKRQRQKEREKIDHTYCQWRLGDSL